MSQPSAIGGYEDWPAFMATQDRYTPADSTSNRVAAALGVPAVTPLNHDRDLFWHDDVIVDGVRIRHLGWQLPFGPLTRATLLIPLHHTGKLPGLLWLNCHGGNKWLGAERLVDIGPDTSPDVVALQHKLYAGRAVANDFARAGFAVLVHDAFSWGSRRFNLDPAPGRAADALRAATALWASQGVQAGQELKYNTLAAHHENTVAKAAALLGTSYAGMVAYEDLTALSVLRGLPGVDATRIGTGGFSGGGGRALVLAAIAGDLDACVIACMMTTHESLFPAHLESHSWLLSTPGLATVSDWPDLTTLAPGTHFLMQYALDDDLFPVEGMRAADRRLRELHHDTADRYRGAWHAGGHVFTAEFLTQARDHFLDVLH
ncbi:alpha/beta hydrolase [Arthrobacter sp. TMT4-20]